MKRNYLLLIGFILILSFAGCEKKTDESVDRKTSDKANDTIVEENSDDEAKEKTPPVDDTTVDKDPADEKKETTPPAEDDNSNQDSNNSKKEVVHDFDSETNVSEENFGLRYQIPSSWKKHVSDAPNVVYYYSKDGMLMVHLQDTYSASFDIVANQDDVVAEVSKAIQDFSETSRKESNICGVPSLSLTFSGIREDQELIGNASTFAFDTQLILFLYTDWGNYDQSADFTEIVNTITFVDGGKEPESSASTDTNTSADTSISTDGTASSTAGQDHALNMAHTYLMVSPFSHSGLIRQLEYEGFSTEEATYAADNCGANWNEQAAKVAQNYLDIMSFSRNDLIGQLEFDGFSREQAEYGVTAVGY